MFPGSGFCPSVDSAGAHDLGELLLTLNFDPFLQDLFGFLSCFFCFSSLCSSLAYIVWLTSNLIGGLLFSKKFFLNSRTMSLSLMLMVRRCVLRGASQTPSSLVGRLRFLPFSMSLAFLFDLSWNFACQACRLLFLSRTCYSRRRHETVQKGTG